MKNTRKIKHFVVVLFTKAHNNQKKKKGGGGKSEGGEGETTKEKDGIVWLEYKDLTEHRCHTTLDTAVGFTLNAGCICKEIRWGWGKKEEQFQFEYICTSLTPKTFVVAIKKIIVMQIAL